MAEKQMRTKTIYHLRAFFNSLLDKAPNNVVLIYNKLSSVYAVTVFITFTGLLE